MAEITRPGRPQLAPLRRAKLRALVRDGLGGGTPGSTQSQVDGGAIAADPGGSPPSGPPSGVATARPDGAPTWTPVEGGVPGGATLFDPATGEGWVLIDDGAVAGFGAALAWAWRTGVTRLSVLVDGSVAAAEVIARRAGELAPVPAVWIVEGRTLRPAHPARRRPAGPGPVGITGTTTSRPGAHGTAGIAGSGQGPASPEKVGADPADSAELGESAELPGFAASTGSAGPAGSGGSPARPPWADLSAVLERHGVDPVDDGASLRGEVLGLEVARAVPDAESGGWRLDVGVGQHDRDARHELRPDQPVEDALDEVVAVVRSVRVPGGPRHPATTLARAGWLRAVLMASPGIIDAAGLAPAPPPLPPGDLRRPAAAVAVGRARSGRPLVVVCSTGIDPDLVPTAADARVLRAPGADLVIVTPEGDDHPLTRALAASLAVPAQVRTAPVGWDSLPT